MSEEWREWSQDGDDFGLYPENNQALEVFKRAHFSFQGFYLV